MPSPVRGNRMKLLRFTLILVIALSCGCGGGGSAGPAHSTPAGTWAVSLNGVSVGFTPQLTQVSCGVDIDSTDSCFTSPMPVAGPGTVWPDEHDACIKSVDWQLVILQTAPGADQFNVLIYGFDPLGSVGNSRTTNYGGVAPLSLDGNTMEGTVTDFYDPLGCGTETTFSAVRQ